MRFFNDSLRLNLKQFFPNDSLVYDVFGLFKCILSKAGNLLLFHRIQNRCTSTRDRYGKHKNPYAQDNKIVDFYA